MSSQQHLITTHYGASDCDARVDTPAKALVEARWERGFQVLSLAFMVLCAAAIGIQFVA